MYFCGNALFLLIMSQLKFALLLFFLLSQFLTFAQSIKDVRINEIQVYNSDGFRDEYGQAHGWIEIHNKGYGKVNLAGCIIKVNGKEYIIPKDNPATVITTQGYLVFYASGTSNRGTFHTNFTLDNTDFIELYDLDGKRIDRLEFDPKEMTENVSYGWFDYQDGKEKLVQLPAITPGGSNNTEIKIPRAEVFKQADPAGVVLTITNIVVVTIALVLLFFVFKYMGKFHIKAAGKKALRVSAEHNGSNNTALVKNKKGVVTNNELAAIAMALYRYSKDVHDNEELTLTINKVSKTYSPWSSKIYGLRQYPNKQ